MKQFISFALILICAASKAGIYYVDVTGDNANDGSINHPWSSIMYAATQVTTAGDTIFINPGVHTLSSGCDIAVGVSINGAGNSSVINITITDDWSYGLWLVSGVANTNGNQSI